MWKNTGKVIAGITRALSGDSLSSADEDNHDSRKRERVLNIVSSVQCTDYSGILKNYKDNLFFHGAICDFYKCAFPTEARLSSQESKNEGVKTVIVKKRKLTDQHYVDLPVSISRCSSALLCGYVTFDVIEF